MKEVIWLAVSPYGVESMRKNQPNLKGGEIAVKLEIEVADTAFGSPTIEQRISITDWREGLAFADPELRDLVITEAEAELIRQQRIAAMRAALEQRGYQVTEPPGDDDG
jgi:hypothetical protein